MNRNHRSRKIILVGEKSEDISHFTELIKKINHDKSSTFCFENDIKSTDVSMDTNYKLLEMPYHVLVDGLNCFTTHIVILFLDLAQKGTMEESKVIRKYETAIRKSRKTEPIYHYYYDKKKASSELTPENPILDPFLALRAAENRSITKKEFIERCRPDHSITPDDVANAVNFIFSKNRYIDRLTISDLIRENNAEKFLEYVAKTSDVYDYMERNKYSKSIEKTLYNYVMSFDPNDRNTVYRLIKSKDVRGLIHFITHSYQVAKFLFPQNKKTGQR
jgi:hypothetical protein